MSEIWEKMGNPVPFERVMGPNRHNMENYGDLQPVPEVRKPNNGSQVKTFLLASFLMHRDEKK